MVSALVAGKLIGTRMNAFVDGELIGSGTAIIALATRISALARMNALVGGEVVATSAPKIALITSV